MFRSYLPRLLIGALLLVLIGCNTAEDNFTRTAVLVSLTADGETRSLETTASNVRELLREANLTLGEADEVNPPPFTPLTEGLDVRVVRVSESVELIERAIPFERRIVRNENMAAEDPAVILQPGQAGREELTVRIVYRDGLEVERRVTQSTVIAETQDEIVMVGLGVALPDNVTFGGTLAFIQGGQAVIMRGNTAFPESLPLQPSASSELTESAELAELDRRVFSLSPTGSHLLYTRVHTNTADSSLFNSLWVVSTARNSEPRSLGVDNVLWADWNPDRAKALQIAYTTGVGIDLPPGWEANNDLWLGEILENEAEPFEPERVVESYPATYGWWGGNYAWSPDGTRIAYSYADEVGLINLTAEAIRLNRNTNAETTSLPHEVISRFPDYDTRADWVWLPSLSWSPDGRYLAFTQHGDPNSPAEATAVFDTYVTAVDDTTPRFTSRFVPRSGIWGYPRWSPRPTESGQESQIAFLRSTDPLDSLRSSYTLWLMDTDGSNAFQLYPLPGENSFFPREEQFMAWSGTGQDIAFVFDDNLYLLNLQGGDVFQVTEGDAIVSHPTWAPYGAAVTDDLSGAQVGDTPLDDNFSREERLPEQE